MRPLEPHDLIDTEFIASVEKLTYALEQAAEALEYLKDKGFNIEIKIVKVDGYPKTGFNH
jgi:hypothetical protein